MCAADRRAEESGSVQDQEAVRQREELRTRLRVCVHGVRRSSRGVQTYSLSGPCGDARCTRDAGGVISNRATKRTVHPNLSVIPPQPRPPSRLHDVRLRLHRHAIRKRRLRLHTAPRTLALPLSSPLPFTTRRLSAPSLAPARLL